MPCAIPQTFLLIAILFLMVTGNQALIFFLPSITDTMTGMAVAIRTLESQRYLTHAARLGILLNGIWAQRTGKLTPHAALPMLATGTSLGPGCDGPQPHLADDGTVLPRRIHCAGLYAGLSGRCPLNSLGKSAAATAVGLICLGNLGGLAGPWLFGYLKTITGNYDTGLWVMAGCMLLAGALATQIRVNDTFRREVVRNDNRKRSPKNCAVIAGSAPTRCTVSAIVRACCSSASSAKTSSASR